MKLYRESEGERRSGSRNIRNRSLSRGIINGGVFGLKTASNPSGKRNSKKAMTLKIINHNFKKCEKFLNRNELKLDRLAKSSLNVYSFDDQITRCNYSLGGLIEFRTGNLRKIFLITTKHGQDTYNDRNPLHFYCNLSSEAPKTFLKFFNELTKIELTKSRFDFFEISRQKFNFSNLEATNYKNDKILIFEVPERILYQINYADIPVINLDLYLGKNSDISPPEKNICFISHHFDFHSSDTYLDQNYNFVSNEIKDKLFQNYFENSHIETPVVNFGELIKFENSHPTLYFKSSLLYGGVGSLVYSVNNIKKPLGIILGYSKEIESSSSYNYSNNTILRFDNKDFLSNMEKYITNLCKFNVVSY